MRQDDEILNRMLVPFRASRSSDVSEEQVSARLNAVNENAALYFSYRLPNWPPHFLLIKVMRRLLWPLWKRQYLFNLAARDALHDLYRLYNRESARAEVLQSQVDDLEQRIEELTARLPLAPTRPAPTPQAPAAPRVGGNGTASANHTPDLSIAATAAAATHE